MMLLVDGIVANIRQFPSEYIGFFTSPRTGLSHKALANFQDRKWAADNSAFTNFNEGRFRRMLENIEGIDNLLFVVAPDVVADMDKTLNMFFEWQREIKRRELPIALALQDGLTFETPIPWDSLDSLFIGGTTRFKHTKLVKDIVEVAHQKQKWVHCGRVNERSRIRYMRDIGVDSIDGTSFTTHLPNLKVAYRVLRELEGQELLTSEGEKGLRIEPEENSGGSNQNFAQLNRKPLQNPYDHEPL